MKPTVGSTNALMKERKDITTTCNNENDSKTSNRPNNPPHNNTNQNQSQNHDDNHNNKNNHPPTQRKRLCESSITSEYENDDRNNNQNKSTKYRTLLNEWHCRQLNEDYKISGKVQDKEVQQVANEMVSMAFPDITPASQSDQHFNDDDDCNDDDNNNSNNNYYPHHGNIMAGNLSRNHTNHICNSSSHMCNGSSQQTNATLPNDECEVSKSSVPTVESDILCEGSEVDWLQPPHPPSSPAPMKPGVPASQRKENTDERYRVSESERAYDRVRNNHRYENEGTNTIIRKMCPDATSCHESLTQSPRPPNPAVEYYERIQHKNMKLNQHLSNIRKNPKYNRRRGESAWGRRWRLAVRNAAQKRDLNRISELSLPVSKRHCPCDCTYDSDSSVSSSRYDRRTMMPTVSSSEDRSLSMCQSCPSMIQTNNGCSQCTQNNPMNASLWTQNIPKLTTSSLEYSKGTNIRNQICNNMHPYILNSNQHDNYEKYSNSRRLMSRPLTSSQPASCPSMIFDTNHNNNNIQRNPINTQRNDGHDRNSSAYNGTYHSNLIDRLCSGWDRACGGSSSEDLLQSPLYVHDENSTTTYDDMNATVCKDSGSDYDCAELLSDLDIDKLWEV